jgi:hypothetical protein
MELGFGPQITQAHAFQTKQSYLGWQARGAVQYRLRRISLSAQALRTVSGGSGVLEGTTVSTGQGAAECILGKYSTLSLHAGVSRNEQLGVTTGYDAQFAGVVLNRKVGLYSNLYLNYDFQHQTSSVVCTGAACGTVGLRNVFGLGFAWNYRPIRVD